MSSSANEKVPVSAALDEVVGSTRQLVLNRIDLLQLEAEQMVEDVAMRLSAACMATLLMALALVAASVALVAWGTPYLGLDGAAGALAGGYTVLALISAAFARRRLRSRKQKEVLQ